MITAIGQIIASRTPYGLLLLLLLAGCSSGPTSKWIGTWEGNMNLPPMPGVPDPNRVSMGIISVTIKPDGTFEMFSMLEKSGTARFSGDKAYLQVDHVMGRPISEQGDAGEKLNREIVLTMQKDGSILYDDPADPRRLPDGSKPPPTKLTRKSDSVER